MGERFAPTRVEIREQLSFLSVHQIVRLLYLLSCLPGPEKKEV